MGIGTQKRLLDPAFLQAYVRPLAISAYVPCWPRLRRLPEFVDPLLIILRESRNGLSPEPPVRIRRCVAV
ncbi:hypothetical protein HGRIS_011940 [Hohenbuehelia grisea]|uniref:Uncharacterized protein n=1 Tax=Hohenbuehelia grisea TaxID=104357 RepID=A0ABR3JXE1_9AGAR